MTDNEKAIKLIEKLEPYLQHKADCKCMHNYTGVRPPPPCTCGLTQALTLLSSRDKPEETGKFKPTTKELRKHKSLLPKKETEFKPCHLNYTDKPVCETCNMEDCPFLTKVEEENWKLKDSIFWLYGIVTRPILKLNKKEIDNTFTSLLGKELFGQIVDRQLIDKTPKDESLCPACKPTDAEEFVRRFRKILGMSSAKLDAIEYGFHACDLITRLEGEKKEKGKSVEQQDCKPPEQEEVASLGGLIHDLEARIIVELPLSVGSQRLYKQYLEQIQNGFVKLQAANAELEKRLERYEPRSQSQKSRMSIQAGKSPSYIHDLEERLGKAINVIKWLVEDMADEMDFEAMGGNDELKDKLDPLDWAEIEGKEKE